MFYILSFVGSGLILTGLNPNPQRTILTAVLAVLQLKANLDR